MVEFLTILFFVVLIYDVMTILLKFRYLPMTTCIIIYFRELSTKSSISSQKMRLLSVHLSKENAFCIQLVIHREFDVTASRSRRFEATGD